MSAVEYMGLAALALLLGRSKATILKDRVRNPSAVPPAIRLPSTRTLLWRRDWVDAWLAEHAEHNQTQPTAPRRGRPRKS